MKETLFPSPYNVGFVCNGRGRSDLCSARSEIRAARGAKGRWRVGRADRQEGERRGMLGERIFMPGDDAKFSFSRR